MARICVHDYIDVGTKGYHDASSYEVALDPNFSVIIDSTYNDKENKDYWDTMLPNPSGGYYKDVKELYVRVKVHIDNIESPWYMCDIATQQRQDVIITKHDGTVIETDSETLGWVYEEHTGNIPDAEEEEEEIGDNDG